MSGSIALPRTYVVTGSSSGIGFATAAYLAQHGHRVVGVARHNAAVLLDLAASEGRSRLRHAVERQVGPQVDGVIACAGGGPPEGAPAAEAVRLNYFGAVSTLTELRPLLTRSPAPRALLVTSLALIHRPFQPLVDACLASDEPAAIAAASGCRHETVVYASAKRASARWVRRSAPSELWAGAGIVLNAAAPGLVRTRLTEAAIREPGDHHDTVMSFSSTRLGTVWEPEQIAPTLGWLVSEENSMITGQCIFVDGGAEASHRGSDIW